MSHMNTPSPWLTGRQRPLGAQLKGFRFNAAVCGVCPLRPRCVAGSSGLGRTVQLHPQEDLLQQARALQRSEAFGGYRQRRVVVEHRLARLVQLGIRQARYFGRVKTRFQLYLAATVANLTLVAGKAGIAGETGAAPSVGNELAAGIGLHHRGQMGRATPDSPSARIGLTSQIPLPNQGFPSEFLACKMTHMTHFQWTPAFN